ncbi:fibrinogen-like protein 1 isoform X2 [Sycon ciliatum]|uniref:fibrinogen-like protein 1 isoform X2 n=1 Tax=Sycon ciliatum TaxID=27933 RepID=UPI0031F7107E
MNLPPTTRLFISVSLLLAVSFTSVFSRTTLTEDRSSAGNETALRLSIQDTETLLLIIGLRQPIDQLNYANADTASLSALLGGRQNAEMLVQCLSGQLEQCRQSPPCSNAGKCIFSGSRQGRGSSYICNCNDGHSGTYCQTVLPSCAGNPCQNGATCQQRGSSFHCHCPPLYTGHHCEKKWLDARTFRKYANTVHQISDQMKNLERGMDAARHDDVSRIETFLQRLEQKVMTKFNSTLTQLSSEVVAPNHHLDEGHGNQEANASCERTNHGQSGLFTGTTTTTTYTTYCDRETDGGGWIVFQRRQDGSVDFYRDWNAYKRGFGSASGEFWLGLDTLHYLTSQAGSTYELRIDMVFKTTAEKHYAKWSTFRVEGEANNYRLHVSGFSSPTLPDSMRTHNGQQFSTRDRDHDSSSSGDCSNTWKGGWWYHNCHYVNVNGLYGRSDGHIAGVVYHHNAVYHSLKFVEMKLRKRG